MIRDALREAMNRRMVEAWMLRALAGDKRLGRTLANFTGDPRKQLLAQVPRLNGIGVRVYEGAGNVVMADVTGETAVIIQRRPLAQRKIHLAHRA